MHMIYICNKKCDNSQEPRWKIPFHYCIHLKEEKKLSLLVILPPFRSHCFGKS